MKKPDKPRDETLTGPLEPGPRAGSSRAYDGGPPTFRPGQRVAARYRVLRFIASGGMGEVYEVSDDKLGERVALKVVRPELAGSAGTEERFQREIQLARKVTHRNVCRIFDLGAHHGPEGEVLFLTMELLEGETLSERLHREGRMGPARALPLVGQMVEALSEAHRAGIVHRDFKSANVMLVPAEEGERVVVTDFGLARALAAPERERSEAEDTVAGTPSYMSPEQVEGAEVGAATDVYALGVVLYEMLTGHLPFEAGTPVDVARRRLREAPTAPRVHVPELDLAWEATILRCLERRPDDRFTSVTDVLRAIQGEKVPKGRTQRRLRLALATAAILAVGVGLLYWGRFPGIRPPRRSLAVLGFKNLSGQADTAWLSTALADLFDAELSAGERLRTVPGEDVARMKVELGLAEADSYGRETLQRIRKNLGSDYVVLGSYLALGEQSAGKLDLVVRLQDTASGATVVAVKDTGRQAELFELVSRTGANLRSSLGLGQRSAVEAEQVKASLPAHPRAARLYAEGLARLRLDDVRAARGLLDEAARLEPEHPLVRSALAQVLLLLGDDAKASAEAKRAFELAPTLSREDRLLVEGRYREAAHDWGRAVDIYRVLWGFFPDDLEYGLALAEAQREDGKVADSMATVVELHRLPAPASEDPRIDLSEAETAHALADFNRAASAAASAVRKAGAQGAGLLAARGHFEACNAYWRLGETKAATQACTEAQRGFEEGGNRLWAASAQILIGNLYADQGDFARAQAKYEEALRTCRNVGKRSAEASVLNNWANILLDQGDLAVARGMYEQALAIHREQGTRDSEARTLYNLGRIRHQEGNLSGARKLFEESAEIGVAIGEKNRIAAVTAALAGVRRSEADYLGATRLYQEARTVALATGNKPLQAEILFGLAECWLARGDQAAARQALEQAQALSAKAEFLTLRLTGAILAARLSAAAGNASGTAEAIRGLEAALAEATKAGQISEAYEARLALGEIEVASGDVAQGRKRLQDLAQEARKKGFGLIARRAAAHSKGAARPWSDPGTDHSGTVTTPRAPRSRS